VALGEGSMRPGRTSISCVSTEAIPDLAALVRETALEDLPVLAGRFREAELLAEMRMRKEANAGGPMPITPDREGGLTVAEAARRIGISASWIYKNKPPFVARVGRRIVCSPTGVARYLRARADETS
jgi:hypothetical protein